MTKYHNKRTEVDGIWFDSKAEARRYGQLKLLLKCVEIQNLSVHPSFLLHRGFFHNEIKHKPIYYEADFKYWDCSRGKWIVEDVKGVQTQVYRIKKKMFLNQLPKNHVFVEVRV